MTETRPCTCAPDERTFPCQHQYALGLCRKAESMMTPKMTPDEIAAIQEWLLILEARDLELPEFHAMQLKVAKTTHVMLDRIAALEAELAAERERRKAAEALLHNYARLANAAMFDANRSGYEYDRKGEMVDISAHFARYKD